MIDYPELIAHIEGEIATLDAKRPLLVQTLDGLRALAGEHGPRQNSQPANTPKAAKPMRERRGRVSTRSSEPDGAITSRILDVLRAKGPMQPGDLATVVGLTVPKLRYQMTSLMQQGVVEATGATAMRRFALTTKRNVAAPAPSPARSAPVDRPVRTESPASSTIASGFNIAEARDASIRARLKQGKATLEELLSAMPAERGVSSDEMKDACKRAIRRLVMKGVVADVGDKYQLL